MSAREERLVTPETIAAVDQWLDDADVFAKGYWQYVNGKLITVGLRIGQDWNKVVAFFGDTIVRHENGSHTVLSAKDATELAALRARVAELEAAAALVTEFCADRASYITSIRNCHPDNGHDYDRWQGHAAARRQLSLLLGLPVAWPAEDKLAPVPQQRQAEDPHSSDLHHDYALGRDLPAIPHQTTGRCPDCGGTFEDCTCGGTR